MGRLCSGLLAFLVIFLLVAGLTGCGTPAATTSTNYPVPAIVTLTPSSNASLESGKTLSFTGKAENKSGTTITEPISYQSSDTAVLTITSSGLACAGTWDSLTSPTVCTPGPAGIAQIRATSQGISSPATTVYVHQHIDNIVVSRITDSTTPNTPCLSVGQTANYQATAYNRGVDITSTVGIFSWQATSTTVVSLRPATTTNQIPGLNPGQAEATAKVPGLSSIYASISGTTSLPITFTVCPVQSIALEVNGTNQTSLTVSTGSGLTLKPTILDTLGNTITGSFLTWGSSDPAAVKVSSSGSVSTSQSGGGSVAASCTPPACNVGIAPTLPVYAPSDVYVKVSPGTTTTTANSTVWVSSTGCGTADGCVSTAVPITIPNFTVGDAVALPATPNSFVFSRNGGRAYLGTDSGDFGTKGLMVLVPGSPSSVSEVVAAPGKVLAVSNDGTEVVVSDTVDTPNQVFIVTCAGTGTCSSESSVPLNITGATAARFSPDGLKVFILANNGSNSTLYVYSALDSLETIPLSTSVNATDVAFLGNGAFAYIAGGTASGLSVLPTCHDPANPVVSTVATPGTPLMIRPLPDGQLLVLDPPGVDVVSSAVSGTGCSYSRPYPGTSGAPFIPGTLAVSNSVTSINLGLSALTPAQFIVSGDANTAYLIVKNLPSVLLFNVPNQIISGIQLAGNTTPLSASLAVNGKQLYVGASDGTVHVLDTMLGSDQQQVSFPSDLCVQFSTPCLPDLVAARP